MIAIDSHVHIYPGPMPLERLVAGGIRLLRTTEPDSYAVLLLCEPAGQNVFDQICREYLRFRKPVIDDNWRILSTKEAASFTLLGPNDEWITVIRGQQIITSERIEVLAIGHDGHIPDDRSLPATIDTARAAGCHVILPWGAGKWLGRRGRLIDHAIDRLAFPGFHLGDNGGRPSFWSVPQFSRAAERNIKILCGSDPLPITHDERRIGTYASAFSGDIDKSAPWSSSIADILEDPVKVPDTIGSPMNIWQFVRSQAILRVSIKPPFTL